MSAKPGRKNDQRNLAKPENSPAKYQCDPTIVAIGASAGGVEALTELMKYLPAETGLAFVKLQHLDPKHHSILPQLLTGKTAMTVAEVSEGLPVKSNHVYIIPPNTTMSISNQRLHLSPREESGGGMHTSLLEGALEGFLVELRNALTQAKKDNALIEKRNLRIKNGNANGTKQETTQSTRLTNFQVAPITLGKMKELYFLILIFQLEPKPSVPIPSQWASSGGGNIKPEPPSHTKSPNGSKLSACCPSPREREVLHFLADGKSNKEIGSILDISTRSVIGPASCSKWIFTRQPHWVRYAIRNKIVEA